MNAAITTHRLGAIIPRSLSVQARARARAEHRWVGWRQDVARFVSAHGLRAELIHVEEGQWARAYLRGLRPSEAVSEVADRLH